MRQHPPVHLVGSIAMADTESVFRAVAAALGNHLRRMPDGETGERHRWIYWQREMLLRHKDIELDPNASPLAITEWDGAVLRKTELLRFRNGVDPATVIFETGYAAAAIASYTLFRDLREDGVIPPGIRFQVALPTPMASGYMYVSPAALPEYLTTYERALLRALDDILATIDHRDLSIQWDICQEVLVMEGYFHNRPPDYAEQIYSEIARLGNAVPEAVELGYHLCYGTPRDRHLVMPKDLALLVDMTNQLLERLNRKLDFIHMPVPQDRTDAAYFEPLRGLRLGAETEIYLGLIHHDDREGDLARAAAAGRLLPRFGIASECGWGRTDPDRVPGLLAAHREAAETLTF